VSAGRLKTKLVLADQVVVSGANFVVGLLVARALGPAGYGQFTLVSSIILFVLGVQVALIDSPMMVLGAALSDQRKPDYFPAVMVGQLLFCVASAVLLLLAAPIISRFAPQWGFDRVIWPALFAMAGFLCQDFYRRYFFVRDRAHVALSSDLACHGSKAALLGAFALWWGLDAGEAFWIIAAASMVGVVVVFGFRSPAQRWRTPDAAAMRRATRAHWDFGRWLLAESMASICASQLVIYITGRMISLSAVGAMAAAMHIVGATHVLLLALENLVPSRAAQIYASRGGVALNRYLLRISLLGGAGTLAVVAVAVLGAELWLRLLYGAAYQGNGRLVWWWGLYYTIGFGQRPFSTGLRVLGRTRGLFHSMLAGAAIAVAFSYPATRALGVNGAMLTLCLVQTAILCVLAFSYRAASRAVNRSRAADDVNLA